MEDLMIKYLPLSLDDGEMRKLSVHTDPINEDSTTLSEKYVFWNTPEKFRGSTCKARD